MDPKQRIEELVRSLNAASEAYYGGKDEIMTNFEWDAGFDELLRLEEETGYILPDSPTRAVSSAAEDAGGRKEPHEFPALSLAKTKKVEELQAWAGDMPIYLSWKLDGLTLVLTYDNGSLTKILTRGNGSVGTNITYLKDAIAGFPQSIPYTGHLVVRGEATISYPDFEAINDSLSEDEEKYANPRNLASGTLSLDADKLDLVRERHLTFNAFTLVYLADDILSWGARMDYLRSLGFTTVDYERTDAAGLPAAIERWTRLVETGKMLIPVDGLVIAYDDTVYASGGSVTGHHATRAGLAFKWQDTTADTTLLRVEWSCAASTITPVAIFEPVQLEGTKVSRASLCNVSELERLGIGADGKTQIQVIKANKIIPKVVKVLRAEGSFSIPSLCPVCGAGTELRVSASGNKTLRCLDPKCPAKKLKKLERFVGKNGMDIDGLSIETLRDFINHKFIADYADIWSLSAHAEAISSLDGYGKRSCEKLLAAIEKSREVHPAKLITALSIPLIGTDTSKRLIRALGWEGFLARLEAGTGFEDLDGVGAERSGALTAWYADADNHAAFQALCAILRVENVPAAQSETGSLNGVTFVITGDVHVYKNRDEFKASVEARGGKVAGSVSKKTDFLVNNDLNSVSSKNTKAKALGVPIISEDDFIARFGK